LTLDEPAGYVETQASPLSNVFGGEERIKNASLNLTGNALPVVNDMRDDAIELPVRRHLDMTRCRRGVQGIDRQRAVERLERFERD